MTQSKGKRIGMRIKPKEKETWEKYIEDSKGRFQNLTQLIKYAVNSYIMGDLMEKNSENSKEKKDLDKTTDQYQKELKSLNEKLEEMSSHLKNLEVRDVKNTEKLKGRILTVIKKVPCTSEEISKILGEDEIKIIEQLSVLMKKEIITFNKNMEYYIKEGD